MLEDSCVRTSLAMGVLVLLVSVGCHSEEAPERGPCTQDSECYELNPVLRCHPAAGVCYDPATLNAYATAANAAKYKPTVEGGECTTKGELKCAQDASFATTPVVLACDGTKLTQVFSCPGGLAKCEALQSNGVRCGDAPPYYAVEGTPCSTEAAAACDFERTIVLECVSGTWIVSRHCAPSSCAFATSTATNETGTWCANGGYSVGDRCELTSGVVCSTDQTKILSCSEGKTVVKEECGTKKCTRSDPGPSGTIACQ